MKKKMTTMKPIVLVLALLAGLFLSAGCGSDLADEIMGAWYAQGQNVPDGEMCFIFCSGNRMKTNDNKCDSVRQGQNVYPYSVDGDTITYTISKGPVNIHVSDITASMVTATLATSFGKSYGPFTLLHLGGGESLYCAW